MAIEVKTNSGGTEMAATNGKGNLGVTLGAIGTGLGILNGGLGGNGILGGNGNVTQAEAAVGISKYYEDRIQDIKDMNAQFAGVNEAICALRERASVSETTNHYQNEITRMGFANVDTRFETERLITDYEIAARTCHFVKGNVYLSPNHLANSYIAPTQVLESHEAREYRGGRGDFGACGCGGRAF